MGTMKRDAARLPGPYRDLHAELVERLGQARVICDPARTLAYGTDASFYRLVPKVVVRVATVDELRAVLAGAARRALPVTFRTAGTSLAGQAITDSILVLLAGAWRRSEILDGGARIRLEPGVIGAEANALLAPYGRKLGPDPASIHAAMIGGIAANNSSGMCCGTAQNSYRTVDSMKIVLGDGAIVDTADAASRLSFAAGHRDLLAELAAIRDDIRDDFELNRRIVDKYRIKNTTGYSLNAFVDYDDPIDILLHLMIGSEGTLGFIAELTYHTVPEHPHKASALIFFPDIRTAARAVQAIKAGPVDAAEMMDRASLRSVAGREDVSPLLRTLGPEVCALLVETRAADAGTLAAQAAEIERLLAPIPTVHPVAFTDRKAEFDRLWEVRKGLFPMVAGTRPAGTTVIIEDVVFPIAHLADGTVELRRLMRAHGYDDAIIFGHALDGNLHFVFMQDFGRAEEVRRYRGFMEAICAMVVHGGGALKGEHGTGRNMAPFVELEWGAKAYGLMKRIKRAFDPHGLLNPGVVINDDPNVYLENLKPLPAADPIIDRCMECGFCEPRCCSRDLTLSPRQRIVVWREIARLRDRGQDVDRLERLEEDFRYLGDDTCAADGLCMTVCPVAIDTGALIKQIRAEGRSPGAREQAGYVAEHFAGVCATARAGLGAVATAHSLLGTTLMRAVGRAARAMHLPVWSPEMPRPQRRPRLPPSATGADRTVVYFPSCVARTLGPSRGAPDERGVVDALVSVLAKAGYDVVFPDAPEGLDALCCGMAFDSKGFSAAAQQKSDELAAALARASEAGSLPILCDTSPCAYTMARRLEPRVYEPIEFIHAFLMDRLRFEKIPETVALHPPCSTEKMGLTGRMVAVARACARTVVVPSGMTCCGFAGDKGFTLPELNRSALAHLAAAIPAGCTRGYSNSRTCEVGLSQHAGIPYQSIVHLVDRATTAPHAPREVTDPSSSA